MRKLQHILFSSGPPLALGFLSTNQTEGARSLRFFVRVGGDNADTTSVSSDVSSDIWQFSSEPTAVPMASETERPMAASALAALAMVRLSVVTVLSHLSYIASHLDINGQPDRGHLGQLEVVLATR